MPTPLRLVKRADGTILLLGAGSDYIAPMQGITVSPQVQVQAPPTVAPLVIAAKISVPR